MKPFKTPTGLSKRLSSGLATAAMARPSLTYPSTTRRSTICTVSMRTGLTAALFTSSLALLTACGSDSSPEKYGSIDTKLAGNFTGTTVMRGYDVVTKLNVDTYGNVLGLATNTSQNGQPYSVHRVVKGNLDGSTLYEFDLIDPSINKYKASGRQRGNANQIDFSFSDIPSFLERPTSLSVYRLSTNTLRLNQLIGAYDALTLDLFDTKASTLNISNHASRYRLNLRYTDAKGCLIEGEIHQQDYQTQLFDVTGKFAGNSCAYKGQNFDGIISYDDDLNEIVMFGSTENNSNAMIVSALATL